MESNIVNRPIVSLNYAPNWGAWEAFREIYCNALDADPTGMIVDDGTPGRVVVTTRSTPTIGDCIVLGEGTKSESDDNIGQFGEGLKLAALAAVRAGGGLTVELPGRVITFEAVNEPGVRSPVLYARVTPDSTKPDRQGCSITLYMPDCDFKQFHDRFCDRSETFVLKEQKTTHVRIFNKGVFVATVPQPGLYHYNFADLKINRDRSIVNQYGLYDAIVEAWTDAVASDPDRADLLVDLPNDFIETAALINEAPYSVYRPALTNALREAIRRFYTDAEVILLPSNSHVLNEAAGVQGWQVLRDINAGVLQWAAASKMFPTVDEYVETINKTEKVLVAIDDLTDAERDAIRHIYACVDHFKSMLRYSAIIVPVELPSIALSSAVSEVHAFRDDDPLVQQYLSKCPVPLDRANTLILGIRRSNLTEFYHDPETALRTVSLVLGGLVAASSKSRVESIGFSQYVINMLSTTALTSIKFTRTRPE